MYVWRHERERERENGQTVARTEYGWMVNDRMGRENYEREQRISQQRQRTLLLMMMTATSGTAAAAAAAATGG